MDFVVGSGTKNQEIVSLWDVHESESWHEDALPTIVNPTERVFQGLCAQGVVAEFETAERRR